MHYIFGYGSLICADSRSRTGVSGEAHPVEVSGIARKWSAQTPDWPATAVSAHCDDQARCNGVYFPVDEHNLQQFDLRERGYRRISLEWETVTPLSAQELPVQHTLWAYVGEQTGEPNADRPIMQSYLDVILNGCLDFGPEFAVRFTELTALWQNLVDDRQQPLYPRPLKNTKRLGQIDQIVETHLPFLWQQRHTHRHK